MELFTLWRVSHSQTFTPHTYHPPQEMNFKANLLDGSLPDSWSNNKALISLETINVERNGITGSLPMSWGAENAMFQLKNLQLADNKLTGGLPDTWASTGAMRSLKTLDLRNNMMSGTIPDSWASSSALQALEAMWLKPGNPGLCGPIPPQLVNKVWGDGDATEIPCGTDAVGTTTLPVGP